MINFLIYPDNDDLKFIQYLNNFFVSSIILSLESYNNNTSHLQQLPLNESCAVPFVVWILSVVHIVDEDQEDYKTDFINILSVRHTEKQQIKIIVNNLDQFLLFFQFFFFLYLIF